MPQPLVANLVCGSPWRNHDFDFARLRLGQAIYDLDGIRVDCHQDYEDGAGIANGDLLVSYTSQVPVTDKASTTLRRWLEKGGRWFALHASNSVAGNVAMSRILGPRFLTHPEYATLRARVTAPQEPPLGGIADFGVPHGLYCIGNGTHDHEMLPPTRWGGGGVGGRRLRGAGPTHALPAPHWRSGRRHPLSGARPCRSAVRQAFPAPAGPA